MNITPYVVMLSPGDGRRSERLAAFAGAVQRAQRLTVLRDEHDWLALGACDAPCIDLADGGLILGHLFASGSATAVASDTPTAPLSLSADDFVRRYWGGYLAVRRTMGCWEVMRDPSGEIPCYRAEVDATHILSSRPDLLFDAGLLPVEFDWTIIAQALAYRDLKPARTAMRGVTELLPGVAARFLPNGVETRCIWSPWTFATADEEIDDFRGATAELKEVTRQCVSAWASCYRRPVAEISGGLDSGIVASCLAADGRNPAFINFWPAEGDSNERPYARAIAERLGLPLREIPLDVGAVDLSASHARDLPRASARTFSQAMDRTTRDVGAEVGADVFFSGTGGDNIFCHLQSSLPALDRYLRQGVGRGLWRTIEDIAHLAPATIWEVVRSAARQSGERDRRLPKPFRNRYMSETAARDLPWPAENPWLKSPPDILPGKRRHIWALLGIQNHLEGYSRLYDAPIISPLLAQPMLELCIRIPTWLWCVAGRNRAVARSAFADALPAAVILRRSKGAFTGFGAELIDANRDLLRDMLLDGVLARKGLLDISAVRTTLERPLSSGEANVELLALVDQEAWIGAWRNRDARR